MPSKVKVVFFDLDDTLYDHSYHVSSAIRALRNEYPFLRGYSVEHLQQLSHRLLEEVHTQLLAGEISLQDSRRIRWQRFLDECHDPERNHDPLTISSSYLKAYYASERVVPGALNLLSELKKDYTIGIISNNLLDEQLKKMRRLGISEYIDLFAISEEVGAAKPDPKIFEVALERAKANAEEAVFIGDSWNTDVAGALNSGIRPIWLNRHAAISPDPRIQEISSFERPDLIFDYIRRDIPTPHITSTDPAKA